MADGTVKWFNDGKGYGFITPDEGSKDPFVHHSSIDRCRETLGRFFGRLNRHRIRHTLGDHVRTELSLSDLRRGGIVYRLG
jgi:hypothetical protein